MYCGTCSRRRFIKTVTKGIVAVIEFDPPSNIAVVELAEEDTVFEEWSCASCKREIGNASMHAGLDRRLKQWREEKDLCTTKSDYRRISEVM
jgi:hypothetical protein